MIHIKFSELDILPSLTDFSDEIVILTNVGMLLLLLLIVNVNNRKT